MELDFAHKFAGGWLGTYAYRGRWRLQKPVRFEATVYTLDDGTFTAVLLDDNYLLDSDAVGEQVGREVRFTKVYRKPPPRGHETAPVQYHGVISDDGLTIAGTWQAKFRSGIAEGVWDARRMWAAETMDEEVVESATQTRELLTVGRT
jgi:hypothetical protein